MKKLVFIWMAIMLFSQAEAQHLDKETDVKNAYSLWKKEWSLSAALHTNGYSIELENAHFKTIQKKWFWQVGYESFHHDKEARTKADPNLRRPLGRSYVYGKQNGFFAVHALIGGKRNIADKAVHSGVALSWIYAGGFSLGILKPYYLYLRQPDNYDVAMAESYSTANESRFLDNSINPGTGSSTIVGYAGNRYGWNQLKPVPGLQLKTGLSFDWSTDDLFVKALEAGVCTDIYYRKVPIMVGDQNHFFFPGFYIAIQMGKRW